MKRCATVVTALAVLVSQSACYTTRIVTSARPEGPPYEDRQWFTLGGLVPVSQPTGQQCRHGVAYADSKLSGTDWLINVGLALAGGLVGGLACSGSQDPQQISYCSGAGATLVPFLVSSRTVDFACAEGSGSEGSYGPPPRGAAPAPPPPPEGNFHPASPPTP